MVRGHGQDGGGQKMSGSTRACVRNLNLRVQKVVSQRSAGACTRCTRANAFPAVHSGFDLHRFFQVLSHFVKKIEKDSNM